MADVYLVKVSDSRNGDDEYWEHLIGLDTSLDDIAKAIAILYPGAQWLEISVVEAKED